MVSYEPRLEKTNNLHMYKQRRRSGVTAQLIRAFVFTQILQSIYFLNPKFPGSTRLLRLYSPVCLLFFFFCCCCFNSVLHPFQNYFSSYETNQSVGRRKRENPEKNHLVHLLAELGLSHMWPVPGSSPHQRTRHSGEMIA